MSMTKLEVKALDDSKLLSKIAEEADCSVRTVRRSLASLEAKGLIKSYKRGRSTTVFTVTDLSTKTVTVVRTCGRDDGSAEHERGRQVEPLVENIVEEKSTPEGRAAGLELLRKVMGR